MLVSAIRLRSSVGITPSSEFDLKSLHVSHTTRAERRKCRKVGRAREQTDRAGD